MFVKTYEPSSYVKYLFEVKGRITLDDFDEAQYKRLYSGYTGEKQFYERIKNCGSTKLWDLRLDYHGEVQYDFLVIHDGYLFHFDIKNFSGHYSFIDNNFVSEQNYVIKDPISQFNGAHIKLKHFCMKHNLDYKILSYVVFINPDFIVTGFNGHSHILFHKDVDRIVNALIKPSNDVDIRALTTLSKFHKKDSKNERICYYPFNDMKKGIKCPSCKNFLRPFHNKERRIICECGRRVTKQEAVHIAFDTIALLKQSHVKTSEIVDFTGIGKTTIKKIMSKNYASVGKICGKAYIASEHASFILKERYEEYTYKIVWVND